MLIRTMNRKTTQNNFPLVPMMEIILVMAIALFVTCSVNAAETAVITHEPAEAGPSVASSGASSEPKEFPDIEMVFVKGGCFGMGDSFREGGDDERPVHEVCLDDFSIGKNEITQEQWQAVMGSNPSVFKECGGTCPVENVSWDDIKGFIEKLNERTGGFYRLPTEAEWEYAARSRGMGAKWSGTNDSSELSEYAWYADNAEKRTRPVGQKKPNSLGIHDMSGNVSEWILDRYEANYYRKSPKEDPRGPESGGYRVLRGGNFYDIARYLRTTCRDQYPQSYRTSCVGFRLVRLR